MKATLSIKHSSDNHVSCHGEFQTIKSIREEIERMISGMTEGMNKDDFNIQKSRNEYNVQMYPKSMNSFSVSYFINRIR